MLVVLSLCTPFWSSCAESVLPDESPLHAFAQDVTSGYVVFNPGRHELVIYSPPCYEDDFVFTAVGLCSIGIVLEALKPSDNAEVIEHINQVMCSIVGFNGVGNFVAVWFLGFTCVGAMYLGVYLCNIAIKDLERRKKLVPSFILDRAGLRVPEGQGFHTLRWSDIATTHCEFVTKSLGPDCGTASREECCLRDRSGKVLYVICDPCLHLNDSVPNLPVSHDYFIKLIKQCLSRYGNLQTQE